MTADASRRKIFSKILGGKSAQNFIAPPYFCGEFDCSGCDAPCVSACEKELLSFENERVNFKFKSFGCDFCEKCALACEDAGREVLNLKFSSKIQAKFSIDVNACLAWNGTICCSCQDICKFRAIDFFGVFRPSINQKCAGCAQCMEVCFVNSIKMEAL